MAACLLVIVQNLLQPVFNERFYGSRVGQDLQWTDLFRLTSNQNQLSRDSCARMY